MALIPWGLVLLFQMVIHHSCGNYLHSGVALSLLLAELVLTLLVLQFVGNVKKKQQKNHTHKKALKLQQRVQELLLLLVLSLLVMEQESRKI